MNTSTRNKTIARLFVEDLQTMKNIAEDRSISRERVRQILEKQGLDKDLREIVRRIRHVQWWKCEVCGKAEWRYGKKQPRTCSTECANTLRSGQMRIPTADLEEEMVSLRLQLGRPPTMDDMNEGGRYSHYTYVRRYGSWSEAKEEILENGHGSH